MMNFKTFWVLAERFRRRKPVGRKKKRVNRLRKTKGNAAVVMPWWQSRSLRANNGFPFSNPTPVVPKGSVVGEVPESATVSP